MSHEHIRALPGFSRMSSNESFGYISNESRLRSLALEWLGSSGSADDVVTLKRELTAFSIARVQEDTLCTDSPKPERWEWRSLPPPRLGPPPSSGSLRAMKSRIGESTSTPPEPPPRKRRSSTDRRRKSLELGAMPRSRSTGSASDEELRT